ncbi:hypothetical protein [Paenibacillus wenxiniae]|uniref:Uncharacterized protein n=1 Tax=Paenibacillus wenxiniae TaxID=1636843 RepID=A0ABW4RQ80_9BACL
MILTIQPLTGINEIKLGMTEIEIMATIENACLAANEVVFSRLEYDSHHTLHYIEISNPFGDYDLQLRYKGIDLFQTKADDLIMLLNQQASYIEDDEAEMGTQFVFKQLGLALWRPDVITEEIVHSKEFLTELSVENQEYEKRNFYFATVSLFSPSYYDSYQT